MPFEEPCSTLLCPIPGQQSWLVLGPSTPVPGREYMGLGPDLQAGLVLTYGLGSGSPLRPTASAMPAPSLPGTAARPGMVHLARAASGHGPAGAARWLPAMKRHRQWRLHGKKERKGEDLIKGQKAEGDAHPRLHGQGLSLYALNGPLEQSTDRLAVPKQDFQTL